MEPKERETLDGIFNKSTITVNGKTQALRFTVSAELWLENNGGIHLGTLPKLMDEKPTETALRLAFAGLPSKEYRDAMTFEAFTRGLKEAEARAIISRVDWILECYFRHLIGEIRKENTQKQTGAPVKKN